MFTNELERFQTPRGCGIVEPAGILGKILNFNPISQSFEERLKSWEPSEKKATERLNYIISTMRRMGWDLSPTANEALQDLSEGNFVIVYSNRLPGSKMKKDFCQGGKFLAEIRNGKKAANLSFIGIIINTDLDFRKPVHVSSIKDQLINAEKALRRIRESDEEVEFLSQIEVDRALYWFWNDELLEEKQK